MKTTLDKLITSIRDCNFYRIAFNTYDEKRVWIIGERNSYLEKIEDPNSPLGPTYEAHLNIRQVISIDVNEERKNEVSVIIDSDLKRQIDESCEEESGYLYKFELAEATTVIDFEKFDTSDRFFEDILENLDSALKNNYAISIEDCSSGQYSEGPLGKDKNFGKFCEISIYNTNTSGINASIIHRCPLDNHAYIFFEKLEDIKEPYEDATISRQIINPKSEILDLIKKCTIISSCKNTLKAGVDKGGKWIQTKIK